MKTILILEDNAREMERLVKIVQDQEPENEVVCTANLEQAYHMAMEKSIDLFLLDIILDHRGTGDASGMTFADNIRGVERYRFTPVIFITALEDPGLYAYSDVNCYGYVEKPYDPQQLIMMIEDALTMPATHTGRRNMYYKQDGALLRLQSDEIIYIENGRSGRIIHTASEDRYMTYKPCKEILKELNSTNFVQCNRYVIVNKNYIETIDPVNRYITFGGRKDMVEIGRTFKKSFLRSVFNG